ncbi:hypothetical protein [Streptomyces sp. NPDC053560]|uniref:hypothetical protein n=1 Tax=Streptomyces sp. NPDC053560 TaxID=3365711 RepID=UPI0037D4E040
MAQAGPGNESLLRKARRDLRRHAYGPAPGHRDGRGMPLGLQLVGHPDRLDGLFSLGHAVEQSARGAAPVRSAGDPAP